MDPPFVLGRVQLDLFHSVVYVLPHVGEPLNDPQSGPEPRYVDQDTVHHIPVRQWIHLVLPRFGPTTSSSSNPSAVVVLHIAADRVRVLHSHDLQCRWTVSLEAYLQSSHHRIYGDILWIPVLFGGVYIL